MRKPSVAAINGFALGGGLELAMCCTVRIASARRCFGQPEVKLGIAARLWRDATAAATGGAAAALEMLLSAEPVTAVEAHRMGLVNQVVAPAELLARAGRGWRKVLANGPLAVGLTMQAVDTGSIAGLEAGLRFEAMAFGLAAATEDRREGTRAFLEKRAPVFTGK